VKILGIDAATKTGWAFISRSGEIEESGVQDFAKRRGESNGMLFLKFRKWLSELITTCKPDLIVYERAHHRGGAATEICVNLSGRIQELAAANGIEHSIVETTSLKKWATGKGGAGKEQMIAAAEKFLGRPPIDDNEADAVLVALWGDKHYGF